MRSPIVVADEERIIQVLLNLQTNAIKFTETGSVTITAEIQSHKLKISVKDTGIGMSEEDQSKLFRLFGFLDDAEQMNSNGIGLGLVISEKLVEQYGGQIWVESKEGEGSTFTFTIMLEEQVSIEPEAD